MLEQMPRGISKPYFSFLTYPTMVRWRLFGRGFIESSYFLQLKLLPMFFKERQAIFAWDGIIIQREHLVGGEVEVIGNCLVEYTSMSGTKG
jgi:hypothetical protein